MNTISNHQKILRLPDVKAKTGLSRSSIYAFTKSGTFPKHISLGIRSIGWLESDIENWIESRVNTTRISGGEKQ